jgi:hypothetical protein
MDSNNTFQNGMNSDISKLYQSKDQYVKALNFRPVTELGSSNASLVNIKGNECQISFPILRSVYKLAIRKEYDVDNNFLPGVVTITVNGETTPNILINENTNINSFVGSISGLPNCYGTSTGVALFAVAYNSDYIVIYQQPEYTGCSGDLSTEPVVTITQVSGTSGIDYVDPEGNLTSVANTYFVPRVNLTDPLVIIGSTFVNENIYIFTCPQNNTNKIGQIWELVYDELTKTTTIYLLYNNYLNFTIDHPIPTSAAIGRYELNNLQRIYWTDFYNPVRTVNVKDVNLMALNVDLTNLRPLTNMSVPVLNDVIDGGAVNNISNTATYQCAYRLTKNNGAITNYSSLSNIVAPIPQRTSDFVKTLNNFSSIAATGAPGGVNKALRFEVQGVDTDYDNIEFVIITRDVSNINLFYVYKFDTQVINGNSTILTTWVNDPLTNDEITTEELLIENVLFSHCKTIEQKDNRLFFGNVRSDIDTILDAYDTRTYRFIQSSNVFDVLQYEGDTVPQAYTISTPNDYANIQQDADLIPLINLGMSTAEDPNFDFTMKYKRLSSDIGGSGPNISYSFGNLLLRADAFPTMPLNGSSTNEGTARDNPGSGQLYPYGYRKAAGLSNGSFLDPTFYNGAPNQRYKQNNSLNTMALEYLSGAFRSYQHNEIYSFGIVFKSRTGETSFVKWIGDIKFPDYSDQADINLCDETEWGTKCPDFRSMFYDTTNPSDPSAYLVVPYINFEVNIPKEVSNIISGYEIVRCLRTQNDRTIKSHGLITQVATGPTWDSSNYYMPFTHYSNGNNYNACDPESGPVPVTPSTRGMATKDLICYHSMESLVDQTNDDFEEDDQLVLTEVYIKVIESSITPGNFPTSSVRDKYYIKKYYDKTYNLYRNNYFGATDIHTVKEAYYVSQDGISPSISVVGGNVYKNQDWQLGTGIAGSHFSAGSPTVVVGIKDSSFDWTPFTFMGVCSTGSTQGNAKMLGLHYKPSVLKNQYGGRTNARRATREYIPTGAYYPVTENGIYTIKVFGGDVFHGILDSQKAIKNWTGSQAQSVPLPNEANANEKHSQTWYFPHQSYKNVDLRDGAHVNSDLDNDAGNFASGTDDYVYVSSFSFENTLKKYYPRPIFFNLTNEWNNRVYYSEVKINGETSDSWTSVFVDNYYDVEGSYGPINALQILKNNMYFVQDRAIGLLIVNPYETVTTQNLQSIGIGTGEVIQKHVYYSIDSGSKHQWSVNRSNTHITFVDSRHKKIFLFDGQAVSPISDTKGNRGFVNKVLHDHILVNDNPIIGKGILTTYDYINNEFLYTFLNTYITDEPPNYSEKYTIVYSDLIDAFSSFYSFTPYIYLNNHNKLYSVNSYDSGVRSKMYLHNIGDYCKFYGNIYPSTLKVNINENPIYTKVFDNLSWISESIKDNLLFKDSINDYLGDSDDIPYLNNTITKIRAYNEYQNTDWVTLSTAFPNPTLRKSEQGYNMQLPRNKVNYDANNINTYSIFDPAILTKTLFGDRMRDKYLVVDMEYNNILNNRFILHNLKSTYRISDR